MKKLIVMLMVLALAISLVACGNNNDDTTNGKPDASTGDNNSNDNNNDATGDNNDNNDDNNDNGDNGDNNDDNNNEDENPVVENPASALEVLQKAWAEIGISEEDKYSFAGGSGDDTVEADAGILTDAGMMTGNFMLPETLVDQIDNASSIMHFINLYYLTVAGYQVQDGVDAEAFATACVEKLGTAHWMCGAPAMAMVARVGNVVIMSFGEADQIGLLKTALTTVYADAQIDFCEAIVE